jgi:acyl-CoA synthetase (AMP-forming)/AMP-acid ligase II
MTLLDVFDKRAAAEPSRPLFSFERDETTPVATLDHRQVAERSAALARRLSDRGVGRGDSVALVLGTRPELILGILAAQRLGAAPAVLNPSLPPAAIQRQTQRIEAKLVVTDGEIDALTSGPAGERRVFSHARADDIAFLQLTSGTAGESKAAAITHAALLASLEASREQLRFDAGDEFVGWVPIHHDLGLVRFVLTPVYFGFHAYLLPPALRSLGRWLRVIAERRATVTGAPDFAYRIAARTVPPLDLSCLRFATNGGEPVRASSIAAFEERFSCPGAVRPGYGLAEATLSVCVVRPGEPVRVDAQGNVGCGRPAIGMQVRVVVDGEPVGPGVIGALQISSPTLFAGYWSPAGLDRQSFHDGWHDTGDSGYLDTDGTVFVLGRTRSIIKRAGALIAPREIEEAADRAGLALGVRLSAAVGVVLDESDTEAVLLLCEVRPGAEAPSVIEAAVARAVRDAIGMPPTQIRLVAPGSIPLTANGKIRYGELKRRIEAERLDFVERSPTPAG